MSQCNKTWASEGLESKRGASGGLLHHRCHMEHEHTKAGTNPHKFCICRCGLMSNGNPAPYMGWRLGEDKEKSGETA